jgi:hypothetical protein
VTLSKRVRDMLAGPVVRAPLSDLEDAIQALAGAPK